MTLKGFSRVKCCPILPGHRPPMLGDLMSVAGKETGMIISADLLAETMALEQNPRRLQCDLDGRRKCHPRLGLLGPGG